MNFFFLDYIQMKFLFLNFLFFSCICATTTYNFPDANITINLISSGVIPTYGTSGDTCTRIIARKINIYHISTKSVYQSWQKGNLSTSRHTINATSPLQNFRDGDVSQDQSKAVIFTKTGLFNQIAHWTLGQLLLPTPSFSSAFVETPIKNPTIPNNQYVKITGNSIYTIITNLIEGNFIRHTSTSSSVWFKNISSGDNFAITPDSQIMLTWYRGASIKIFNVADFSSRPSFTLGNTPSSSAITKKITFSADSQLAIIQSDAVNPLVVYNLSSGAQVYSVAINQVIDSAHFVNSSKQLIVVFGNSYTSFINITSNSIYKIPNIEPNAVDYTTDLSNNIFTCYGNVVRQRIIELVPAVVGSTNSEAVNNTNNSTNNTNNSTNNSSFPTINTYNSTLTNYTGNASSNTNSTNGNLGPSEIPQNTWGGTEIYNYSYAQFCTFLSQYPYVVSQVYVFIRQNLEFLSNKTNFITTAIISTPTSIYFLGYLNYFSMSSLYVLLNFKIPSEIFFHLSMIYQQINKILLGVLGIQLEMPVLSEQRTSNSRGVYFGISSDVLSSYSVTLTIMFANIFVILVFAWICSFLSKNNPFRKIVSRQKWNMIFGHIINIIMPLTLPWTFFMLENGVRDFASKINAVCYLILYFLGLFFPIFYFFELLQDRETKLIEERNAQKQAKLLRHNKMEKTSKDSKNKPKDKQIKLQLQQPQHAQRRRNRKCVNFSIPSQQGQNQQIQEPVSTNREKAAKNTQKCRKLRKNYKHEIIFQPSQSRIKSHKLEYILQHSKHKLKQKKKREQLKPLTLSDLITFEILEQWYLCQANFLLPCLVLLSNPVIFLVVIQLYTILGVIISFNKKQMRVNSTLLSLYPFLFHICFMVFYWADSEIVIAYTEMLCLVIFLIGVAHHFLTMIFEIGSVFIRIICYCKNKNQVQPDQKQQKETKKKANKKDKISKSNQPLTSKQKTKQPNEVLLTKKKSSKAMKRIKKTLGINKQNKDMKITFVNARF